MNTLSLGHKSYLSKLLLGVQYSAAENPKTVDGRTSLAIRLENEWGVDGLDVFNYLSRKLDLLQIDEITWGIYKKAKGRGVTMRECSPFLDEADKALDGFETSKKMKENAWFNAPDSDLPSDLEIEMQRRDNERTANLKEIKDFYKSTDKEKPVSESKKVRDLERKLLETRQEVKILREERKNGLLAENFFETIKEQIQISCLPFDPLPKIPLIPENKGTIHESLVMHISDEHADQIVEPHKVNGLENYNLNVALRRAETYVEKMLDFTKTSLHNYRFHTLWMLHYGDHVNGWIHNGTENSALRNDFANAIAVGQMHSLMLRDLAPHFEEIKVIYIPGNHGRQTPHKDFHNALRNLDYLVAETNYAHSKNLDNVEFMVPDSYSVNVNIEGFIFNITHGDSIKGWNGIPWYGIERRNRRLQAVHSAKNEQIHYKVMGHFHQLGSAQDSSGETLLNGSWKATDEYLYSECGGYSNPMQLIHGVHEKYGVSWRMPVHLRTSDDTEGPKRYKLEFAAKQMELRLKDK